MKFKNTLALISLIAVSATAKNNIPFNVETPNISAFEQPSFQPSGCVEMHYKIDKNNKPIDITMMKHYPENAFTNQAYNKLLSIPHTYNNLKKEISYLQFNGSENWPLPFECLTISKQIEQQEKTYNQFLKTTETSEIRKSIDKDLFLKIYKNIEITNDKPTSKQNKNGSFDVTINYRWSYTNQAVNDYIIYIFNPKFGTSVNKEIKSISIERGNYNTNYDNSISEEIFNYIGQRKLVIEAVLNNRKQTFTIGTPINATSFCKGRTTNKLDFNNYCFISENTKGHPVTFTNIPASEIKQLTAFSRFRIENTYLK